jgi:anthranilate synthase component II
MARLRLTEPARKGIQQTRAIRPDAMDQAVRLLLIDNYDSFTWNLVQLVGAQNVTVDVVRNDAISAADALDHPADAILLSPGPCTPNEAGICLDVVKGAVGRKPVFGVCLGLQAIGQAFGGDVVRAPAPMHGKVSVISHHGSGLFRGINRPFEATRYHSLVIDRKSCPDALTIEAETDDGLIMAAAHRTWPICGVQFHPESIMSEHGATIIRNFLDIAATWRDANPPAIRAEALPDRS